MGKELAADIRTILGLPAHPLLVHIPVVLVPLSALGAVAAVISEPWRRRLGWSVVWLAGVAVVGTQLVIGSGETLEENVDASRTLDLHRRLGEQALPFVLSLLVALLALMLYRRWKDPDEPREEPMETEGGARPRDPVALGLAALVVVSSVLAVVWVYRAGHTGAESVWGETTAQPKSGREDVESRSADEAMERTWSVIARPAPRGPSA